ncbi:MAG: hypothetical protein HY802_05815 [Methanobacterium sp.]|nr:hypothetical protein [Methanobacterium sp.]
MNHFHGYYLIIGFLVFVVLTSGCITVNNNDNLNNSQNITKNFSYNGVNFSYPGNWQVSVSIDNENQNIIVTKDYYTQLQIMITPNYGMSEEGVLHKKNYTVYPGWKKISEDTLILDNQTAYRTILQGNDIVFFFNQMRHEEILFVKNNNTFTILTTVPTKDYNEEKQSFETIMDSIHVQ